LIADRRLAGYLACGAAAARLPHSGRSGRAGWTDSDGL